MKETLNRIDVALALFHIANCKKCEERFKKILSHAGVEDSSISKEIPPSGMKCLGRKGET